MKREPTKEDLEQAWEYAKSELIREDGLVDWDKLKKFIYDWQFVEEQVSKVYCEITGNKMSYPNYYSGDVIAAYEEELNKIFVERPRYIDLDFAETGDWVSWVLNAEENGDEVTEDEKLIAKYHSALFNYIESTKLIIEKIEDIKAAKNVKDVKAIADKIIKDNSIY